MMRPPITPFCFGSSVFISNLKVERVGRMYTYLEVKQKQVNFVQSFLCCDKNKTHNVCTILATNDELYRLGIVHLH